MLLNFYAR